MAWKSYNRDTSAARCSKEDPLCNLFAPHSLNPQRIVIMEFQNLELTLEDMLQLHREWISKLYVEDMRSESEIVELLHERRLFVRPSQVRRCINDWNLTQMDTPESSRSNTPNDWDMLSTQPRSEVSQTTSYTPSDPDLMILYTKRPLPSLPLHKTKSRTSSPFRFPALARRCNKSRSDSLTLAQNYQDSWPLQFHEIETSLRFLPPAPSPIELYIREEQAHERFAVSIERPETTAEGRTASSYWAHRRSGEAREDFTGSNRVRVTQREARKMARRRKRSEDSGKGGKRS